MSFDHFQSGLSLSFMTRWPKIFFTCILAFGISLALSAKLKFLTSLGIGFSPAVDPMAQVHTLDIFSSKE